MRVACVLVTHLRAKVEMRRQPDLRDRAVLIVDRSRSRPLVIDHFPAASGVAAGMTLEQALSRQTDGAVLEADEAHYRRVFHRMLTSLQGVSDRVEGGELGTAYVRLDGLEALYGGEARLVNALLNAVPQYLMPRFGLHTLGDVAAMKVEALTDRFGPEGRRAWELSLGIDDAPLVPLQHEESVVEQTVLPFSSASLELLLTAADTLLRRAYARPRIRGRYAGGAALECILYRAQPWRKEFHFKQPVGDWRLASRIIRGQLEAEQPQAPVEEVTLALSNLTGESGVQLSLLSDVRGDRERRLAEAERQLQARMGGRPVLYRVVQVAPWHPAPEMRAMRVPIEASGIDGIKPLSAPYPVAVEEGQDGQPAAVRLGERWHRVAGVEDLWCFDLWWMPQPITRTYYRVGREGGGEMTLFRDRREDRWFRQSS